MSARTGKTTIAHVVWSLEVGGLERVVTDLVSHVDPERFASIVYCLMTAGELADTVGDHSRVIVMNKKPGRSYLLPVRLARSFRKEHVDVVHSHNIGPLLYGAAGARIARVGHTICTLHGPDTSARYDSRRIDRIRRLDRIVAVSDHVRAVAVERGMPDSDNAITIHNGIDHVRYGSEAATSRDTMREALALGPDDRAIGVVARLTHEKDHATLLEAFALVAAAHPSAKLLLVGDGTLRSALERQAHDLGIASRTAFLGTRIDIAPLLGAFDLFVLPSRIEGLGITLLEAMAAGLPTIATAVGGIPEIARPETTRIVTAGAAEEMAGAMRWMLDNPEQAGKMGAAGRKHVADRFSLHTMVARYESIYEEFSGGAGHSG